MPLNLICNLAKLPHLAAAALNSRCVRARAIEKGPWWSGRRTRITNPKQIDYCLLLSVKNFRWSVRPNLCGNNGQHQLPTQQKLVAVSFSLLLYFSPSLILLLCQRSRRSSPLPFSSVLFSDGPDRKLS